MTRWQDAHGPTWNGLAPGQSWAIPAGPQWQARLDRVGRAHVIGRALAEHAEHGPGYAEDRPDRWVDVGGGWTAIDRRARIWHTFERACRAASYHERIVIAVRRNAAQVGQGGE